MRPDVDLVITGGLFCDLVFTGVTVPEPGTEVFADAFLVSPGGSANRAVMGARLGRRTAVLTEIGDDTLGQALAARLRAEPHLDLTWLHERPGLQTPVSVALTSAHDRSFITYAEPLARPGWPEDGPTVGVAHIGIDEELPDWVRRLRAAGTQVVAGAGWDATGAWPAEKLTRLAEVDVFVPNDVEAMRFTRTDSARDAARALGAHVPLAVVTCGRGGALAYDSGTGELLEVPGVAVDAVDPTGAGDVFVAAFMASYDLGWDLADRIRLANLCAALSVRSLGGATSAPDAPTILRHLGGAPADDVVAAWVRTLCPPSAAPTPKESA